MKNLVSRVLIVTEMDDKWQFNRFRERLAVLAVVLACFLVLNLGFCWSLNDEGMVGF